MQRFSEIRNRVIAVVYKKMNTFDEREVINNLVDSTEETFFLKKFLMLTALNKAAFSVPESFSQFLPFVVEETNNFLLAQRLIRINEQRKYLPQEFSDFFDEIIRSRLTKLENSFVKNLPDWEKDRNLNSWHIKKIMENEPAKFIIIDGMRADFYCILRDQLKEKTELLLIEENFCLSLSPSDTDTYYQFLDDLQIPIMKTVEREYNISKFKEQFLVSNQETCFYMISFLDEKIHAEKAGIANVLAEFMERLKTFLFPILSQLKKDEIFYLSSDHGFIEKTGYHYKDTPRYSHGGDSLYERIVPIAKFRKI